MSRFIDVKPYDIEVEVTDNGSIILPQMPFTVAELRAIARAVSRAMRRSHYDEEVGDTYTNGG